MSSIDDQIINKILTFWFEESTPQERFGKDDEFDTRVKNMFEELYWEVLDGSTASWRETPEGRLAEIIVLDQFARNIFRDTAQAFAGDVIALRLAREALSVSADEALSSSQRLFLYLPFMHSESSEVHQEALELFNEKSDENGLQYEIEHKEIIDRFGRYPHRNKAMGRESTSEELKFLEGHLGF